MIVIGLDPGKNAGAAVALDISTDTVIAYEVWKTDATVQYGDGFAPCANAATRLHGALRKANEIPITIRLVSEAVHIRVFPKRVNEVELAKQLMKKGWIDVPGGPSGVSLALAKSMGIWIAHFPYNLIELQPGEWRKMVGIENNGDLKGKGIARAMQLLPESASRLRATISDTNNDHLAEAVCIAYAGIGLIASL